MIDAEPTLGHHFFQISQAEFVGQIPADTQQDHRTVEMTAFEHRNASQDLERWYHRPVTE